MKKLTERVNKWDNEFRDDNEIAVRWTGDFGCSCGTLKCDAPEYTVCINFALPNRWKLLTYNLVDTKLKLINKASGNTMEDKYHKSNTSIIGTGH